MEAEPTFLDACVLFPPLVRGIVLGAADAGIIQPFWSQRVLDEWRLAVARKHDEVAEASVLRVHAAMALAFPDAWVLPDPAMQTSVSLPDPDDAHVVAGALAAEARAILTFNIRDFPKRSLAEYGLVAIHPDGTFWSWLSAAPARMKGATDAALAGLGIAPDSARSALKRAQLGRFAKAFAAYPL